MGVSISRRSNTSGRSNIDNISTKIMKKWFSETISVDLETGEILSKSRLERETGEWIYKQSTQEIIDCGAYLLKKITKEYEKSKQLKIDFR